MASIFITGSADGLGQLAAKELISQGHRVVLHARNEQRGREALDKLPDAETVLIADLQSIEETIKLAERANAWGGFDAVIHNAGVYTGSSKDIFAVNTLAPYILTCLVQKPKRLIYLSSGMHLQGHSKPESFKRDVSSITYSDTKLHMVMLSKAIARKWAEVYTNAVNPGWVPTKMGGSGAPDDLQEGYETQVWLAVSDEASVKVSGRYFFHKKERPCNPEAGEEDLQERFLEACREITGVSLAS